MKIICHKKTLSSNINIVQKSISSKTSLPILQGILLEAFDNKLKLIGTNLEIGIECLIDAQVISEGSIVLSSKIFGDIIRKLPDDYIEIYADDKNNITIKCKQSEFILIGQSSNEFPELPTVEEEHVYEIQKDLFKNMIKQTVFATAIDDIKPILTGVLMEIKEKYIHMVALDGYRLALRKDNINSTNEISCVIPGKTLNEINRIISDEDHNIIKIYFTDKHVLFNFNGIKVISRLLDGEFINYNQIIPNTYKSKIKVNTQNLLDSIERASLLAKEGKNNLIKLSINDENIIITSNSEIGRVYESVDIELEGDDIEIGFNSKYFLESLKTIGSDEIFLKFTTNVSPCIIEPIDSDNYIYLILPVRLSN